MPHGWRLQSRMYVLGRGGRPTETLEFTAYDDDRAVQAIVDRALEAGDPIDTVTTEDGRLFRIKNP